ncbi:MAG: hypothetical protein KIG36_03870 [Eubacteriales bacterium]|nr:hypothetical protein [Eubacteriales bacterium]
MYRSIKDFGAIGDSAHNDAAALQAALDSGERELYVPAGKYRIDGTLKLHSHTYLRCHPEAYFILADGAGRDGDSYLLTADQGAEDITVYGGHWNGNGPNNCRSTEGDNPYRGILISFTDVKGLRLSNMVIRDSEAFHVRLSYVRDFVVENITFDDHFIKWTQDGIHLGGGCENGLIRHIRAVGVSSANDDLIALITDLDPLNMSPDDPIWGQRAGDIRNIEICDVEAQNTFSFLRLSPNKHTIENVHVHDVRGGCHYIGVQMEISPYIRDRYEQFPPEEFYGKGVVKNVRLTDWNIHQTLYYGTAPRDYMMNYVSGLIDIEKSMQDFVIENFRRDKSLDAKADTFPTLVLKNFRRNRLTMGLDGRPEIVEAGYTPYVFNGERIDYLRIDTL